MAPKKLWRPVKEWMSREWATKKEAWLRVHVALSENIELTRRDLKAHLLAKRLVGAARIIAPDGSERCIIIKPAFWEPVELSFAWSMTGCEKYVSEGEAWHFFVRRRELDRHYPVAVSAEQTEPQQPAKLRHTPPGPSPTHDWPEHSAFEVGRIVERENKWPSAPRMCGWCMDKWRWEPDDSDMRELLRRLKRLRG
jgi:hypothetical protein